MKNKYIFIAIILIIVAGIGLYIRNDLSKLTPITIENNDLSSGDSNKDFDKQINNEDLGQINDKMPDIDREFHFDDNLPSDVKEIYLSKINSIIEDIRKSSDFIDNWLVLGVYLKAIGDYSGAEEMWQYAGVLRPLNSTSFANLGNLYTYELKDYVKAEANFKKALSNDPNKVYIYTNFFELYKYGTKDMAKAKAVLEEGIAANPDTSDDLQSLLSNNF